MGKATMALALAILAFLTLGCVSKHAETDGLEERAWQVPANFYDLLVNEEKRREERRLRDNNQLPDIFEGGATMDMFPPETLPGVLDVYFNIPLPKEASLRFSPNDGELVVRHYPEQLDQLDELIRSLGPMDRIMIDRKMFHTKGAMVISGGFLPEGMVTRRWYCAKEVLEAMIADRLALSSESNPFVDPSNPRPAPPKLTLKQEFMRCGIAFPEGASIAYDPDSEILTCAHQMPDLAWIELLLLHMAFKLTEEQAAN